MGPMSQIKDPSMLGTTLQIWYKCTSFFFLPKCVICNVEFYILIKFMVHTHGSFLNHIICCLTLDRAFFVSPRDLYYIFLTVSPQVANCNQEKYNGPYIIFLSIKFCHRIS